MRISGAIRRKNIFAAIIGCAALCTLLACEEKTEPSSGADMSKVPLLILDTDLSSDVDDVGAVALLHALADQGKVQILAMQLSSVDPWTVPCLAALNSYFGRPDIPIGMVKGQAVQDQSKYTRTIAEEFFHEGGTGADALDAVLLYRRILAEQANRTVILVTIGYLTNLANLLHSEADEISPLDGMALVQQKVQRLVCMGGEYPSGREWNFYRDSAASSYVIAHWPTPVVFSGFEIGKNVLTGAALQGVSRSNPVRRSYELYNSLTDRPSWDQVTVYYAMITANGKQTELWSKNTGRNIVRSDGSNYWLNKRDKTVDHAYLVQHGDTEKVEALIEQLMLPERK